MKGKPFSLSSRKSMKPLPDDGEDEVGVLGAQKAQLALRALQIPLAPQAAAADADLRLVDVEHVVVAGRLRVQKGRDAVLLIVGQKRKDGHADHQPHQDQPHEVGQRQPGQPDHDEPDEHEQQRHAQIGLDEDQPDRHGEVGQRQQGVGEAADQVPPLGQELGEGDGDEDAAELRRLNLERRRDLNPAPGVVVHLPGDDDRHQQQHQPGVEVPVAGGQHAVVDGRHDQQDDRAQDGPDELLLRVGGEGGRAGDGAADHQDAIGRQQQHGRQQPDVEVAPDGGLAEHSPPLCRESGEKPQISPISQIRFPGSRGQVPGKERSFPGTWPLEPGT
jgi:hypothetical protein